MSKSDQHELPNLKLALEYDEKLIYDILEHFPIFLKNHDLIIDAHSSGYGLGIHIHSNLEEILDQQLNEEDFSYILRFIVHVIYSTEHFSSGPIALYERFSEESLSEEDKNQLDEIIGNIVSNKHSALILYHTSSINAKRYNLNDYFIKSVYFKKIKQNHRYIDLSFITSPLHQDRDSLNLSFDLIELENFINELNEIKDTIKSFDEE